MTQIRPTGRGRNGLNSLEPEDVLKEYPDHISVALRHYKSWPVDKLRDIVLSLNPLEPLLVTAQKVELNMADVLIFMEAIELIRRPSYASMHAVWKNTVKGDIIYCYHGGKPVSFLAEALANKSLYSQFDGNELHIRGGKDRAVRLL